MKISKKLSVFNILIPSEFIIPVKLSAKLANKQKLCKSKIFKQEAARTGNFLLFSEKKEKTNKRQGRIQLKSRDSSFNV